MRRLALAFVLLSCSRKSAPAPAPAATPAAVPPEVDEIARLEDARDLGGGRIQQLYAHADPRIRALALRAAGRIGDPAAMPGARAALRDADAGVRIEAASAVAVAGDAAGEPALIEALGREADAGVRSVIARALGIAGTAAAQPALVREASWGAVGMLGQRKIAYSPETRAALVAALDARIETKRWGAAYALFRLPGDLSAGERAALLRTSRETKGGARAMAIRALGAHGPLTAEERGHLVDALADPDDWRVRVEAARGLAGSPEGAKELAGFLASALMDQPLYAALDALLPQVAVPEVAAAARKLAADGSVAPPVRCAAAILAARAPAAPDAPAVRAPAADSLQGGRGGTGGIGAAPVAEGDRAADGPPAFIDVCGPLRARGARDGAALRALLPGADVPLRVRIAERAAELAPSDAAARALCIELLRDRDAGVVAAAAEPFKTVADKTSVEPLVAALTALGPGPSLLEARIALCDALGNQGDARAQAPLSAQLSHWNVAVRHAARAALERLKLPAPDAKPGAPPPSAGDVAEARSTPLHAIVEIDRAGGKPGRFTIQLAGPVAPRNVASFVKLARDKFYDGLAFHRDVPDFVIQGGDPRGDGYGGAPYAVRDEPSLLPFERGAVGIALGGKDTGSSQFFITHSLQPHLDGRYTIIGRVPTAEEMTVVDQILPGDRIKSITIVQGP